MSLYKSLVLLGFFFPESLNFTIITFPLFVPEMSTSFTSYIVELISINFAQIL